MEGFINKNNLITTMKTCSKCGIEKEFSEFYKIKSRGTLRGECKLCYCQLNVKYKRNRDAKYPKEVIKKNCIHCNSIFEVKKKTQKFCSVRCRLLFNNLKRKDKHIIESRLYREKNKELISVRRKLRYQKNKERESAYAKEYRIKYPDRYKERSINAYRKNREQKLKYGKKYRENSIRYFQQTFGKNHNIEPDAVSIELAETYKQFILLKREVRNVRNKSI